MTSRRALCLGLVIGSAVLVALALATPFLGVALRVVVEEFYPAMITWEGKTAWRRCDSAIAGETSWPRSPEAACAAMHLCANEAPLVDAQRRRLADLIRGVAGCQDP